MDLIWAALVYPATTSNPLKPKKLLEDYFFSIMRSQHGLRDIFIRRCIESLSAPLKSGAAVEESLTSTILSLFLSLLQTSPVDDVVEFVESSTKVPDLLINEAIQFLKRSVATTSSSSKKYQTQNFSQRLAILRFVYGQSDNVSIEFIKLKECWDLTASSVKLREEVREATSKTSAQPNHTSSPHRI